MGLVALLLLLIGMFPVILAVSLWYLYPYSKITIGILFFLGNITLWQIDVSILYMGDFLSIETIEFLFKLFRIGPIMTIPSILYTAYLCSKHDASKDEEQTPLLKISNSLLSKKAILIVSVWGMIIYIINWTPMDIANLSLRSLKSSHGELLFYYPEYGSLSFLFKAHLLLFFLAITILFLRTRYVHSPHLRTFLIRFIQGTMILFVTGLSNFAPRTGLLVSSLGIILFSIYIIFSFMKMHHDTLNDYQNAINKQQRLDYMGTITSTLIHELKNSLTMLKGYSKLLTQTQSFDKKGEEWIKFIELGNDQLDDLVNSYSTFLEKQEIEMKISNVNKVIQTAIDLTRHDLDNKGLTVELNGKDNIRAVMNDTYMHQVFVNLIKNSIEATPADRKQKKINIFAREEKDNVYIDFFDSGTGIPRYKWNDIFTPFISEKTNGMGIGLSFCKKVLFEHHGNIEVIGSNKEGTHFRITLPQYTQKI